MDTKKQVAQRQLSEKLYKRKMRTEVEIVVDAKQVAIDRISWREHCSLTRPEKAN